MSDFEEEQVRILSQQFQHAVQWAEMLVMVVGVSWLMWEFIYANVEKAIRVPIVKAVE
jgi:hypothetical protein